MARATSWLRNQLGRRWFPWAVLGIVYALGTAHSLLTWLWAWLEYRQNPPNCYGLGWGCSLDPGGAAFFTAFFWSLVLVPATATLALTEFFWRRVAPVRSVLALILLALATLLFLITAGAVVIDLLKSL